MSTPDKELREQIRLLPKTVYPSEFNNPYQNHWKIDIEELEAFIEAYAAERERLGRIEELEMMNKHYALKGGNILLYERDGENLYLGDRIAELQKGTK